MAPKKQTRVTSSHHEAGELHSDPQQSVNGSQSQVQEAKELQEAGKRNRQKTKERREQQKKLIMKKHEKRQEQLRLDVTQCLQTHDEKVRAIRRPKLLHLLELTRKKRALEQKIEDCGSELDIAFLRAASQLQASLEGRIGELSE